LVCPAVLEMVERFKFNPDFAVEWNSDKVSYIWIWNTTIPIN
jgi:hypothetical protein